MTLAAVLVTEPAAPVVDVDELKLHLRIDHDDEDALLTAYERAATKHLEAMCGLAFVTQTWRVDTDTFATCDGRLRLPRAPVQSITSVQYYASGAGSYTTVTASNYRLLADSLGPFITAISSYSWPSVDSRDDAIRVTFVAGYGDSGYSVPDPLRHAVALLVGHWFRNREAAGDTQSPLPFAVDALAAPYRRWSL